MRLIVISFYSGVIFVLHSDKEYQLLLSSYSGMAFVLQSNQETTFAYPLTQAWPSSCGQTKRQLLLILLLRHGLRLAVKPRNNFCLFSYSGMAFVLLSIKDTTFAYPLTQAWPSSCGQTKKQLLLILLLRHGLRLALGQSSALLILAHAIAVVHASEPLHQ